MNTRKVNLAGTNPISMIGIIGLTIAALTLSACSPANSASAVSPDIAAAKNAARSGVKTVKVDRGDIRSTVTATGNVVASAQSALSIELPGIIVELPITEGQHVEKGQLLARVDDSTLQAALQQADFAVQAAQSALDRLLQPVDARDVAAAEANVKTAQSIYSSLAGAVSPDQVKAAQLNVDKANAAVSSATELRNGAGGQFKDDDPNYQKTVAQLALAQTNAEIAQLKLEQVRNGRSLLQATANIAYSQARLAVVKAGPRQIDVDDAQAQLAIAKINRDQAQHMLDKTRLVAPYSGTLSKVNVHLNEASVTPAVILVDDNTLYIDAQVNETDIAQIVVGQTVEVTMDALAGTPITGKVQRINLFSNATPGVVTYTVRIAPDKTDAPVKVGMTANATLVTQQAQNVLRIPNEYLIKSNGANAFTVMKGNTDGTFTAVAVQVGVQGPTHTEILTGLNEGDMVGLAADVAANQANTNPATAVPVNVSNTDVTINVSGQIQANQKAALTFATTGKVATLNVAQGDHVLKGQIIATLDNTVALDALLLAQAKINAAQIPLHRLTDQPRLVDVNLAKASVALANASLKAALGTVDRVQAKIAALGVDAAKNALWYQQLVRDADKLQKDKLLQNPMTQGQANLLPSDAAENGQITSKDYDVQIAQAQADAAAAQTGNIGTIASAQEQVTIAQNALSKLLEGGNKDDIARVQAALQAAQAAFDQAKTTLNKTVLTAPFDGVVAQLNLNLGEPTPVQSAAALLIDTNTYYVDLPVAEVDIAKITVGQDANLRFAAIPRTVLTGKVTRIGTSGASVGGVITYTVRVEIDPASAPVGVTLLPSMTTNVSIVISKGTAQSDTQATPSLTPAVTADASAMPSLTPTASETPIALYTQVAYVSTYAQTTPTKCTVTAKITTYLRGEANENQSAIGVVGPGSLMYVNGRTANHKWWLVMAPTTVDVSTMIEGWVRADYVTPDSACTDQEVHPLDATETPTRVPTQVGATEVSTPCTLITTVVTSLRPDPSLQQVPLAQIPDRTALTPISKSADGGWWQVTYGPQTGWVGAKTVMVSASCTAVPTQTP